MGLQDFGALLRSGMAAVPDYGAEQAQQQELAIRQQQASTQAAALQQRMAEAQQQLQRQGQFQTDLTAVMANPNGPGLGKLMAQYPEFSEGLKRGWDAMDADRKVADLRQSGAILSRVKSGDLSGAAKSLRDRIAADKAKGEDTADDEQLAEMLESDDPAAHKMATTLIAAHIRSSGENGAKFVDSLFPAQEVKDGLVLNRDGLGQVEVGAVLPGNDVYSAAGVGVFKKSDIDTTLRGIPVLGAPGQQVIQQQGGGDPASSGGGAAGGSGTPPIGQLHRALLQQESGDTPGKAGPQTAYGQPMGAGQMLIGTAREMAQKLGIKWDPKLYSGKGSAAGAYQRRLSRAYLEEGLAKTGNVRDALRFYHGGPDRSLWGPKTNAYADAVLARTGGKGQQQAGGDLRAKAQEAIAAGAPPASVAARFKQMTGQDL